MKNKNVAALLAFFLGGFGIHKFYLNNPVLGIVYLVFCWTYVPSIISFIEFIMFLVMSKDEFDEKYNKKEKRSIPYCEPSFNGAPQPDFKVDAEKVCGKCSTSNDADAKFCYKCGNQL